MPISEYEMFMEYGDRIGPEGTEKPNRPNQLSYEEFMCLPLGTPIALCHNHGYNYRELVTLHRYVDDQKFEVICIETGSTVPRDRFYTDKCLIPYANNHWNQWNWVELATLQDYIRASERHHERIHERIPHDIDRTQAHQLTRQRRVTILPLRWQQVGF
jgi:hypothetical protein